MKTLSHILVASTIVCWSAGLVAQERPVVDKAPVGAASGTDDTGTGDASPRGEDVKGASMDEINARGFAAFDRGDFTEAAAIFIAAHEIYGDPNLIKNAAIAYYAAGRCDRARKAALTFLKDPDAIASDREEMTRLIGRCDALAKADQERAKELEEQRKLDEQKELERQKEFEKQKELAKLDPPPTPGGSDDGISTSKVLGGVFMGLGSATLVGTAIYHVYAFGESEELREISLMGGEAQRYAELSSAVDTARVAIPALYAAGGALLGGGAWLVFRPERDQATKQTRVGVHFGYTARF